MVNNRLIWTAISNRSTRPSVTIDLMSDVWLEEVIKVFVVVLSINGWADDVVIDTLSGVYVDVIIDVVFDIGVEVLTDVDSNVLIAAMTALFVMAAPWEESMSLCWAPFSWWSTAVLDCDGALQAWIPSYHVCWSFALPTLPQFLNQEPPIPQQLILPDLLMVPHLGHAETVIVVVSAGVFVCALVKI